MRIAQLGTGIMGAPMARQLAKAGNDVVAWNRTRAKAQGIEGVSLADTPAEGVSGADVVVTMLSDGAVVEEVMRDAIGAIPHSAIWWQCSTVGLDATERLRALAEEH